MMKSTQSLGMIQVIFFDILSLVGGFLH